MSSAATFELEYLGSPRRTSVRQYSTEVTINVRYVNILEYNYGLFNSYKVFRTLPNLGGRIPRILSGYVRQWDRLKAHTFHV